VCWPANYLPCFLNRQIILLLTAVDIPAVVRAYPGRLLRVKRRNE
jgi:hypothetical protein